MTQTVYDVQGNPITRTEEQSDEVFSGDELDAIQICAANIDSIVTVATNGPTWLTSGQASADAAAQSAGAAANSATSSQNSATAANSSNVAAAASASASATSAQNAATAASSATASSNAAAVSAQAAQDASVINTDNPALLPSGGNDGDVLYRQAGNPKYGIWGPTRKLLDDLDDVVMTPAPAEGDRLTYTSGSWKPRTATSSTTLAGLTDVALTTPADGEFLGWDSASTKWKNKVPAGGGGGSGSSFIPRGADKVGPLSYTMVTADLFGFKKANVSAGDVEFIFDGNMVVPAGQRGWGFIKLIGADGTRKVKFTAGSAGAAPAAGTFGTPIFKQVSASTSNTALTNAQNVAQSFVIPQGLKCAVALVYCWTISTTATDDSTSTGFVWNGITASPLDWNIRADTPTARLRGNIAWMFLGDIPAGGLATSFQPVWTDYGGNGRVNAYSLCVIPYYGADPGAVEAASIAQIAGTLAIDQTCLGAGISGVFREVVYVSARRSSVVADGTIVYTNATAAGTISSSPGLQNGLVTAVAHENAATPPTNNTAHAAYSTGTTAYPWVDCSFAFIPAGGNMNLLSRGNKALEMKEANQMCGWMYDQEQKIVDLVF